jgi:antitoxin component YwqK of YwqJK toxin-antitoxin module
LLYEMHYALGKRTGTWRNWDETGKLVMERNY